MSSTKYTADIGFENNNAYKYINKALKTTLKHNFDVYIRSDYEIAMDGNMAFVKFNDLNKKHIIETMNKIARSLKMDENCFSVMDNNGEEIDVFSNEEVKEENLEKDEHPFSKLGFTKYQLECIKMLRDYTDEIDSEKGKVNKLRVAMRMFQYIINNMHIMYIDLLPSNKERVNRMIKSLIDKLQELKEEVINCETIPIEIAKQAVIVFDTADIHMNNLYNNNNK
jgi:hypothetical protein